MNCAVNCVIYTYKININNCFVFYLLHLLSSSTLILEGVKRVWGKDGYLPQKETAVTASPTDEPSAAVQPAGQQEAAERLEPQPEPSMQTNDKQQLASSLFVGLSTQSSTSLVRKLFYEQTEKYFMAFGSSTSCLVASAHKTNFKLTSEGLGSLMIYNKTLNVELRINCY